MITLGSVSLRSGNQAAYRGAATWAISAWVALRPLSARWRSVSMDRPEFRV